MNNNNNTPAKMANSLNTSDFWTKKEAIRNQFAKDIESVGYGISVEIDLDLILWNVNPSRMGCHEIACILDGMVDTIDTIWERFTKQRVRHVNEEAGFFKTPEGGLSFGIKTKAKTVEIWGNLYGEDVVIATIRRSKGMSGEAFLDNPKMPKYTRRALNRIALLLGDYGRNLEAIETIDGKIRETEEVVSTNGDVFGATRPTFTFDDAVEIVTPVEIPTPAIEVAEVVEDVDTAPAKQTITLGGPDDRPLPGSRTLEEILDPLSSDISKKENKVALRANALDALGYAGDYESSPQYRAHWDAWKDLQESTPDVEFDMMGNGFSGIARVYLRGELIDWANLPSVMPYWVAEIMDEPTRREAWIRAAMDHLRGVACRVRIRDVRNRIETPGSSTRWTGIE